MIKWLKKGRKCANEEIMVSHHPGRKRKGKKGQINIKKRKDTVKKGRKKGNKRRNVRFAPPSPGRKEIEENMLKSNKYILVHIKERKDTMIEGRKEGCKSYGPFLWPCGAQDGFPPARSLPILLPTIQPSIYPQRGTNMSFAIRAWIVGQSTVKQEPCKNIFYTNLRKKIALCWGSFFFVYPLNHDNNYF